MTPPLESGVLPGVYRAHLLEERNDIDEEVLGLDDLLSADQIYLCNAVHGMREAVLRQVEGEIATVPTSS